MGPKIAVLIPCLNEERTIAKVVRDFREQLPDAEVHVFDNASTDGTHQAAEEAGAVVHTERQRGKGHVVQSMFRTIDADVYIMVDGDDTYPADAVHDLLGPIAAGEADMVVGSRFLAPDSSFRPLNRLGNQFFLRTINTLFGAQLTDVLSGYRAMSRRFVKGLPLFVPGFEVEVEMTIKALERGYRLCERPARLRDRPEGSQSKLRKFRDGWRILKTVLALVRDYRPLMAFGPPGLLLLLLGLLSGKTLLGAGSLVLLAGLVLHVVNRRFRELDYLTRMRPVSSRPRQKRRPAATRRLRASIVPK